MSTYTSRPSHEAELATKMQKPHGRKNLAHATAGVGLGGTGKTQLVRHYIEKQQGAYDTILWLDVQDESSAKSSFERCCNALRLSYDRQPTTGRLGETPPVQELHQWLKKRDCNHPWLVVLDNADDPKLCDLVHIIPKGVAGSVIITSQDCNVAMTLGLAKKDLLQVDVMKGEEAVSLLGHFMNLKAEDYVPSVNRSLERLADCLDRIPLAIGLAGARLKSDIDNEDSMDVIGENQNAVAVIQRYLQDLDQHQRHLLSDDEYNDTSQYNKTIWTVWETALKSLEAVEVKAPTGEVCPLQLFRLITTLDQSNVQRELFRSASLSAK